MVRDQVSIGFVSVFLQSANEDVELNTSHRSIISSSWISARLDSSLSSAHVTKQGSCLLLKASKHPHRHNCSHRSHHHHHHHQQQLSGSNAKQKRPSATDSLTQPKEEVASPMAEEVPSTTSHEPQIDSHVPKEEPSAGDSKAPLTDPNEAEMLPTVTSK